MRGALIPHDAQVRRISWVVGSVGRQATSAVPRAALPVDRPPFAKRRPIRWNGQGGVFICAL